MVEMNALPPMSDLFALGAVQHGNDCSDGHSGFVSQMGEDVIGEFSLSLASWARISRSARAVRDDAMRRTSLTGTLGASKFTPSLALLTFLFTLHSSVLQHVREDGCFLPLALSVDLLGSGEDQAISPMTPLGRGISANVLDLSAIQSHSATLTFQIMPLSSTSLLEELGQGLEGIPEDLT